MEGGCLAPALPERLEKHAAAEVGVRVAVALLPQVLDAICYRGLGLPVDFVAPGAVLRQTRSASRARIAQQGWKD
jgi:hypothetical protein